jgi:hypothetical protein
MKIVRLTGFRDSSFLKIVRHIDLQRMKRFVQIVRSCPNTPFKLTPLESTT